VMYIRDMENEHLYNAIRFVERHENRFKLREMPTDVDPRQWAQLTLSQAVPSYAALLAEAEHRNLNGFLIGVVA
jgi:hypothetical protein